MGIQLSDRVESIVGEGESLVMSNFSFSHNVFKSCLFLMRRNECKGLRRGVLKGRWSLKAEDCITQVVTNTDLTVVVILVSS